MGKMKNGEKIVSKYPPYFIIKFLRFGDLRLLRAQKRETQHDPYSGPTVDGQYMYFGTPYSYDDIITAMIFLLLICLNKWLRGDP